MAVGFPAKTTYADGDVFSASDINDTNGTLNLAAGAQWAAGKNKIINGDMRFNQRNFTSISGSADTYGFDRFKLVSSGGATWTPQTFTPGAAPVAGYEGVNFSRIVTSGQTGTSVYTVFNTSIEDVRVLAGQSVTLSFWAKSASGTPKIALEVIQAFGSGGSPSSAVVTYVNQATISTSWTRYTISFTMPSISGKTIGTTENTSLTAIQLWVSAGTDFNARTGSLGIQSNTFDIWGVQLEQGSTATAFQTATGTIQGELAACQRYYIQLVDGVTQAIANACAYSSSEVDAVICLPVTMRTYPTLVQTTGTDYFAFLRNNGSDTFNSLTISPVSWAAGSNNINVYNFTEISSTAGHAGFIRSNNAAARLGVSAEL